MRLEALKISQMASGNLSLEITEDVTWEDFPSKAAEFLKMVVGRALLKITAPDTRIWLVWIRRRPFFLTFDDFPYGMGLESLMKLCNPAVRDLFNELKEKLANKAGVQAAQDGDKTNSFV